MKKDWATILHSAHKAAEQAGLKWESEGRDWFPCGFAWVTIPATSSLARFCREQRDERVRGEGSIKYGDKGYPKGWVWWCPAQGRSQSMEKAKVCAKAFAAVLIANDVQAQVSARPD